MTSKITKTMKRQFLVASILLCALSCTEQEEVASNAAKPKAKWINVEDRYKYDKQSSNGRTQDENPLDPFEFLCLENPPNVCCEDRPFGAVLTWTSSTHSFESGSPYRFAYDGPSGKSNYRIAATAGQELTYSMRVDGTNSDQGVQMTILPTDGAYASMETSYGTVVYDPANGGEQRLALYDAYADKAATTHTFTIPKNPYANRELKVKIHVGWLWFTTVPEGCVYGLPLNSRFPGFYISDLNDRPWVEITLPPAAPTDPTTIPGLHAWYKYKAGVTSASGLASAWNDQSGNNYHMTQGTSTKRPAYDASTGAFTGDGVNDFLRANAVINQTGGEVTAVIEVPTSTLHGAIFSKSTSPGAIGDDNNVSFGVNASKNLYKQIAVGTGAPVISNNALPSNTKVIVSWSYGTKGRLWINGIECSYYQQSTGNWLVSGNNTFMTLFAQARPGGHGFTNVKVYDVAYHNHELTTTERANLVDYYRSVHGIL
jgi:hypothetical protein